MYKPFLIFIMCTGINLALAPSLIANPLETAQPSADEKAKTDAQLLLQAAGMYMELGDYEKAQASILDALKTSQAKDIKQETRNVIVQQVKESLAKLQAAKQEVASKAEQDNAEKKKRVKDKHLIQLGEARSLLSDGKPSEASRIVSGIIGESDDPELIKQAKEISEAANSTFLRFYSVVPQNLLTAWKWLTGIIIGSIILFSLYRLLKLMRDRSARKQNRKWIVNPIQDTTTLGIGGIVVEQLNHWKEMRPAASSGLIRLELIRLPGFDAAHIPDVPQLENPEINLDLAAVLEQLKLELAGVSVGGIAKAASSIRSWFTAARPSISGTAVVAGEQVVVNLTRRDVDGTTKTVSASADKSERLNAAEAASYKMYYLLATESNVSSADTANKLREGLNLLGQYVSGSTDKSNETLDKAYKVFHSVRLEDPTLNEAFLYEGIALDLMEKHDEAIKRFHYLAQEQNTQNKELREKASYNEAVSRFRKYRPEELEEAIEAFDKLVGPNPSVDTLVFSPVKALSYAAKANAIAHKPLFWQDLTGYDAPEYKDEEEILKRKDDKKDVVSQWIREVGRITSELTEVRKKAAETLPKTTAIWDSLTLRQLAWAIENARGNTYLNYAKSFFRAPYLKGEDESQRRDYFNKAYDAFQNCEMTLPPGVETFTNLATVLLELSRMQEARDYLEQAIAFNPQYEYAYYRLAQAWEKEGKTDEVVKVLRRFRKVKAPSISGFISLYSKYAVELAEPE